MRYCLYSVALVLLLSRAGQALAAAGPGPAHGAEPEGTERTAPSTEIVGVLKTHPHGETAVAPASAKGGVIHIQAGDMKTEALDNLPVVLSVSPATADRAPAVSAIRLQPVAEWDRLTHLLIGNPNAESLQAVSQAVESLREATQLAVGESSQLHSSDVTEMLRERTQALRENLITTFMNLRPDQQAERRTVIETYAKNQVLGKAFYDAHDNQYFPSVYSRIYDNSQAGVAVARRDTGRAFCSGVLISPSAILTAQHCLDQLDLPLSALDIWINYESGLDDQPLKKHVYHVMKQIAYGRRDYDPDGPDLDFALLEIGPESDGTRAGDHWHPDCLSTSRVLADDPLYVVGHPQGRPRTVADNAFVLFPFEVGPRQYAELEVGIEAEFKDDPQKSARLKEFSDSYRSFTLPDGSKVYRNYSVLWEKQPTIGADSDTFHGNSGSPVFNRRNNLIVGILHDGQPDLSTPYRAGWHAHEAIVPITRIIEQLDKGLPSWRQQLGVCIAN